MFVTLSNASAQTMINGLVKDAANDVPLMFATISIKGTTSGTTTDLDGEYHLQVDPGTYTLVASYMGYVTLEKEITVADGEMVSNDFALAAESIMGEEIVVTAMLRGQKAAISSQLNADGIVNAVSQDQIQELPDANAGDALGRLSGISLKRSGGEAQNIVVRGLNEKFSSVQLNGVQVPSTDGESRGVDLSMFSLSSLAGIEVTKSLTPDQDADAIAGSVNLVTKKASSKPKLRIDLGTGYNDLESSMAQYNVAGRYERRLFDEKLGVQLSLNAEQKIRSSEAWAQEWSITGREDPIVSDLTLNYTDEIRKRTGGSLLLDFATRDGGTIRFNNFYNRSNRDYVKYTRDYLIDSWYSGYTIEDKEQILSTLNNSISGENYFKKFKINWNVSNALTIGNTPYDHTLDFNESSGITNVSDDLLEVDGKSVIPYAKNNYEDASLSAGNFETAKSTDQNLVAYFDLERKFEVNDDVTIKLKIGAKTKNKNRTNVDNVNKARYSDYASYDYKMNDDGSISDADYSNSSFADLTTSGNSISLLNFLSDPIDSRDIFGGEYTVTPMINADLTREWYAIHEDATNANGSKMLYNPYVSGIFDNYTVKENVNAGYFMTTIDLGKMFRVLAGVRVEQENNSYTAKYAPEIASAYSYDEDDISDTTRTFSSTAVLPNFHFKFKPVDWFDLRLAATKSLARPDFTMRLPTLVVDREYGTVEMGNPDLKNTEAWNYDVIASFYKTKYGLFTVGAFYKKMDNYFYTISDVTLVNSEMIEDYNLPTEYGNYDSYNLSTPVNTNGTVVKGLEFDLQANLTFLPGILSNFVIRGNYSIVRSKTFYPRFHLVEDQSTIPYTTSPEFYETEGTLPGQPSSFGNLALGYDQGGFSARISVFFQGDYVNDGVSATENLDIMQKGYSKWDLALKQEIKKYHAEILLNVSNITNMQEGTYYKYHNLDMGSSIYGMLVDLGLRVTL